MVKTYPFSLIDCQSDSRENNHKHEKDAKKAKPDIILLGLNHKTASVELRECFAFNTDETKDALENLYQSEHISEVMVFSTCNRVEILMAAIDASRAVDESKLCLSLLKNLPVSDFENNLYIYYGDEAVRHLFKVASSLDSMMIGEPQILGQVKDAYIISTQERTSGVVLNRLLHRTFFVAKRVRTETGIGDHAVSISYAAIELGKKIFGSLEGKKVLLIGAGEMAEIAVEHLKRNRVGNIFVANRTFSRGLDLAQRFNGNALRIEEIDEYLKIADIIISSTGSSEYIIDKKQVKGILRSRKNRPLFFIDIAVPRDIDPDINRLGNTYVYDIDDLKNVIEDNIEDRRKEAVKAERIIDEAVIRFRKWFDSLDVVPTIVDLREKMNVIASAEIRKTVHGLPHFSESDIEAIDRMVQAMLNKILHHPTIFLKNTGNHGNKSQYIDLTRKLFNLDDK